MKDIKISVAAKATAEQAAAVFWAKVAELHPECKTGDMAPIDSMDIEKAMVLAVARWLANNAPVEE